MYGSEKGIKGREGLAGIKRMDKVPSVRIRDLYGVMKGVDERIDEDVRWLRHVENGK